MKRRRDARYSIKLSCQFNMGLWKCESFPGDQWPTTIAIVIFKIAAASARNRARENAFYSANESENNTLINACQAAASYLVLVFISYTHRVSHIQCLLRCNAIELKLKKEKQLHERILWLWAFSSKNLSHHPMKGLCLSTMIDISCWCTLSCNYYYHSSGGRRGSSTSIRRRRR